MKKAVYRRNMRENRRKERDAKKSFVGMNAAGRLITSLYDGTFRTQYPRRTQPNVGSIAQGTHSHLREKARRLFSPGIARREWYAEQVQKGNNRG